MSVTVILPDGHERVLDDGATGAELATDVGGRLGGTAIGLASDGELVDLARPLDDGAKVALVAPESDEGVEMLRHSTAHVLAQAVLELWPGSTFSIGPAIEDGFYYDFELPNGATFTEDDLVRIEAKMVDIVKADQPFVRDELDRDAALELFADHSFKREIIENVTLDPMSGVDEGGSVSVYRNSDAFVDLCRGPHVPSTGKLGHFKLMRVAGAYWRGDESRPMLQRIYGTAWADRKSLKAHLQRLEEAAKRDHRKLAVDLDLLSFNEDVGPGLALWHPKGAVVRSLMEDYSRMRHRQGGYEAVYSPHIARSKLWETSGHLDFYAEGMFPAMEMDKADYHAKPMNCPFHMKIFDSRQRSYRELPLRLFELGTVYRYERSGVMHGLMRLRGFTQDDAHIFCTPDQAQAEIIGLIDFVISVLRAFGFDEFEADLSTRPEGKSVGSDADWDKATDELRVALEQTGLDYGVDEGGGAFYGPKIDIHVKDAIGRRWQLSTIQVDFQLGPRFGLGYIGADNERHTPVVIHRALFGSIERFFGVLVEHFAGAFPTWLAPVQARVLPVRDDHNDYAHRVAKQLRGAGFRSEVVEADVQLGKRIRDAKVDKLPYVLVVGDDDVAADTVGVNPRGAEVERDVSVEAFLGRLGEETAGYL